MTAPGPHGLDNDLDHDLAPTTPELEAHMTGHVRPRSPRRRHQLAVLTLTASLIATTTGTATGTTGPTEEQIDDAREQVEQLDEQVADSTALLEALEEDERRLRGDVARAADSLQAAEEAADDARSRAEAAAGRLATTETELRTVEDELAASRAQLDETARKAWMHGGASTSPAVAALGSLTSGGDIGDSVDVAVMMGMVTESASVQVQDTTALTITTQQLRDRVRTDADRAGRLADEAVAALDDAAARNADVLALLEEAAAATRRRAAALVDQEDRRRDAVGRVDRLEAERDAALERARRAAEEEARRAAEEEARRATDEARGVGEPGGGGTDSFPIGVVNDQLRSVGGITVATSLAPSLQALLRAASADGIALTGYGYRSPETTAQLRMVNGCPDVYESPPSACRVPTARPGESMHEQGLAIDFNFEGRTICYPRPASSCVGNPAFDWLSRNAGRFRLQVLDAEAWHWSTNGR